MSIESFDNFGTNDRVNSQIETARLALRAMGHNFATTEAKIDSALRHLNVISRFKEEVSFIKDPLHDFSHHEAVLANCIHILNHDPIGPLNTDVVEIAAWSHDIERPDLKANNSIIRQVLELNGQDSEIIDAVIKTINCHSFGQKQTDLEAKVLYDADKVEYVSYLRMHKFDLALLSGKVTEQKFERFKAEWQRLIPKVRGTMHFEVSKALFDLKFKEAATNLKGHNKLNFVCSVWYNFYHGSES